MSVEPTPAGTKVPSAWFHRQIYANKLNIPNFSALFPKNFLEIATITEGLTTQQLHHLKALVAGEAAISSTNVMSRYHITSATSAARSKAALIKNNILDNVAGKIYFRDPIYAHWLKTEYFALV